MTVHGRYLLHVHRLYSIRYAHQRHSRHVDRCDMHVTRYVKKINKAVLHTDAMLKAHFDPIQRPWTDSSLGFCSYVLDHPYRFFFLFILLTQHRYLNLCYGDPMFTKNPSLGDGPGPRGGTKDCRYQHFQVTPSTIRYSQPLPEGYPSVMPGYLKKRILGGELVQGQNKEVNVAQWINCDLRRFDYSLLGQ